MPTTRLSSKNQVTIPVGVLREVGLGPGDPVDVEVEDHGRIVLRRHRSRFADFIGAVPNFDFDIDRDRDGWAERETRRPE